MIVDGVSPSGSAVSVDDLPVGESFEGWDVFSGSNAYGSPCLVVIPQDAQWVRVECTAAPAELIADTFPLSQSDSRMIRFVLDGDNVNAWVYPHAGAER